MRKGKLITFEGIDGVGKSTIAASLAEALRFAGYDVLLLRQPGNSSIGPQVREMIFKPELNRTAASILIQADRIADIHENILPALIAGKIVICDRYIDSTTAYQSFGEGWPLDFCLQLNEVVAKDAMPDITFWLYMDVQASIDRSLKDSAFYDGPDQKERLKRIADGYAVLANMDTARWRPIWANRPIEAITEMVLFNLRDIL